MWQPFWKGRKEKRSERQRIKEKNVLEEMGNKPEHGLLEAGQVIEPTAIHLSSQLRGTERVHHATAPLGHQFAVELVHVVGHRIQ